MKKPHKALDAIAAIAGNLSDDPRTHHRKTFSLIYRLAHSNSATQCNHPDWEDESQKVIKELLEVGEI